MLPSALADSRLQYYTEDTKVLYVSEILDMTRVSSADFMRRFGELADVAMNDPVTITKNNRDRLVMLSVKEYQRLMQRDRKVYRAANIPADLLEAISQSKAPEEAHQYDDEDQTTGSNPVAA